MSDHIKHVSLYDVSQSISKCIKATYNKEYWIKAEILKLNYHERTGHCYPQLVQKQGNKIIAEMRSNIWSSNFQQINNKLKNQTNSQLSDNIEVLFKASIVYHPVYGLSLNISDIDVSFALGKLEKERKETIAKLNELNIYNKNKKIQLALIPKRIAIISEASSKGFSDFENIIKNNQWQYKFHYKIFNASLQGDIAINSIITQLRIIEKNKDKFDVVAIIRGGGGDVGFHCYNKFELCKTIAEFPLPILTGIGHSTNETVCEMISHQNLITPTDLAYFFIQKYHNIAAYLDNSVDIINNYCKKQINESYNSIRSLLQIFKISTLAILNTKSIHLKSNYSKIAPATKQLLYRKKVQNETQINRLYTDSKRLIAIKTNILEKKNNSLNYANQHFINNNNKNIQLFNEKIKLMDPKNVLQRGYSITYLNGKAQKYSENLNIGDEIETVFFEGKKKSKIIK